MEQQQVLLKGEINVAPNQVVHFRIPLAVAVKRQLLIRLAANALVLDEKMRPNRAHVADPMSVGFEHHRNLGADADLEKGKLFAIDQLGQVVSIGASIDLCRDSKNVTFTAFGEDARCE